MTVKIFDVIAVAEKRKDSGELDDLVHEVASSAASEANNQGIQTQIVFLEQLGWSYQEIINALEIGDEE